MEVNSSAGISFSGINFHSPFFQTSLREAHKKLHLLLAGEKEQPSSAITTCTLISSSDNVESKHLLLLVKGFVPSIADYHGFADNNTLKITTTLSKNPIPPDCFHAHQINAHLVIRNAETVVRASLEQTLLEQYIVEKSASLVSEWLYKDGLLSLALNSEKRGAITVKLENELCVVGSLEDIEVPDEFKSMASQLLPLLQWQ